MTIDRHQAVLQAAYQAWCGGAALRATRQRAKRFTYGDQWGDTVTDRRTGLTITERDRLLAEGARPVTNNLIRQLVKTIVGRYRADVIDTERGPADKRVAAARDDNELDELDSRALEDFLIGGAVVQRVDDSEGRVAVSNVGLDRFFINAIRDPRGLDCELIGQLHDMSLASLLRRVARGSRRRAAAVRRLYSDAECHVTASMSLPLGGDATRGGDFWSTSQPGKCRAIEVWTLESREAGGARWDVTMHWHCRWFTPRGDVLAEYDSPWSHGGHPFVFKLYPLTDGEVHPVVEDVIDQQMLVNNMVTVLDQILRNTAKGVLLYPESALPDGFTWKDIRGIWSRTGGILPYAPRVGDPRPEQVSVNGTGIGAFEMIQLQLQMIERASGVTGALQGLTPQGGSTAGLYRQQSDNAAVALTDVYDTFTAFRRHRNRMIQSMVKVDR